MTSFAAREIATPLGPLRLVATEPGLAYVGFVTERPERITAWIHQKLPNATEVATLPALEIAQTQLTEYFHGQRRTFDIPLDAPGTPFQTRVWNTLTTIPYGQTCTYHDIARRLSIPGSERAVGAANGANPIGIIIPCHRVIGANGHLTGYAGGIRAKAKLLAHERAFLGQTRLSI